MDEMSNPILMESAPETAPETTADAVEPEVKPEAEVKPEEPKKEDLLSRKFAALSRKEKMLREREAKFSAVEKELAELKAKLNSPEAKKPEVKIPIEARLKRDPLGTLKELGYDFSKLTDLALSDGKLSHEDKLELYKEELDSKYKSEIETLRAEIAEKEKANMQKQQEDVINNFKNEIKSFIESNEDYELIRANDVGEEVFNVIEEHHKETGKVMSIKEAADLLEAHLEEKAKELAKLKKFNKLFQPNTNKPAAKPNAETLNKPTLTNSTTSLSGSEEPDSLDEEVLRRKAASLIKWE